MTSLPKKKRNTKKYPHAYASNLEPRTFPILSTGSGHLLHGPRRGSRPDLPIRWKTKKNTTTLSLHIPTYPYFYSRLKHPRWFFPQARLTRRVDGAPPGEQVSRPLGGRKAGLLDGWAKSHWGLQKYLLAAPLFSGFKFLDGFACCTWALLENHESRRDKTAKKGRKIHVWNLWGAC